MIDEARKKELEEVAHKVFRDHADIGKGQLEVVYTFAEDPFAAWPVRAVSANHRVILEIYDTSEDNTKGEFRNNLSIYAHSKKYRVKSGADGKYGWILIQEFSD